MQWLFWPPKWQDFQRKIHGISQILYQFFLGLHGKAFYLQQLVARSKQNPRPPTVNTFGACTGTSVSLKILRKRSSNHRCGAKKVWMFYWKCLRHQCFCWEKIGYLPRFPKKSYYLRDKFPVVKAPRHTCWVSINCFGATIPTLKKPWL